MFDALRNRLQSRLAALVRSLRKPLLFGLYGAVGCSAGWLLGELLLWALKPPRSAGSSVAPSLVFSEELSRRLQRERAQTGDVQLSLMWNNYNDLDLHCVDPTGEEIFFDHKKSRSQGELDVDMNANQPYSDRPVENIYWPNALAPGGSYQVYVNHYALHGGQDPTAYRCGVHVQGRSQEFVGVIAHGEPKRLIHHFDILDKPPFEARRFWYTTLMIGLWTALLSLGLALALLVGQNRYLRLPWLSVRQGFVVVLGGILVGVIAGALGQLLFGVVGQWESVAQIGRVLSWMILGALVGRGMAFFIPNLARNRATWAGACGGLLGAVAFVYSSALAGDMVGRLLGAVILGFLIGLMIALVEELARDAWVVVHWSPKEQSTVSLGARPVVVGTSEEAQIRLPRDRGFPSVTATFCLEGGEIQFNDLMSGRKQLLRNGSKVIIGPLTIETRTSN